MTALTAANSEFVRATFGGSPSFFIDIVDDFNLYGHLRHADITYEEE